MDVIGVKETEEVVTLTFDMSAGLGTGETLTGVPVVTIRAYSGGVDRSASSMLNGSPNYDSTLTTCLVSIQGGKAGYTYKLKAETPTTVGGKVLALSTLLKIASV